jgi:hypothetical protein
MDLTDVHRALGRERFEELIRGVSMGSLKTYRAFDNFKIHAHLHKLNRERLRRAIPQLWARIEEGDQDLAREVSQAALVSNLALVAAVLDFLGIPHDGSGFFEKDTIAAEQLKDGWQQRVWDEYREKYPPALVLLYINHLDWELGNPSAPFIP